MNVDLVHTFVGCNRVVNALDWGRCGLIAYAAQNAVVVCDSSGARVLTTLTGHGGRVNCVCWLPSPEAEAGERLASGGADHVVIVWRLSLAASQSPWHVEARLEGHSGTVTALAAYGDDCGTELLVSAAADSQVIIWSNDVDSEGSSGPQWRLRQSIAFPLGRLQHAVAVSRLEPLPGWLLLAVGGVDNAIRLYIAAPGEQFVAACQLAGHGDWVRSISISCPTSWGAAGERLLLASASQDKMIRIWAIQADARSKSGRAQDQDQLAAGNLSRYAPSIRFSAGSEPFRVSLEALLVGHEDWVHTVAWQPQAPDQDRRPCLLSASMDRTMALWRPDAASGLWMSEESVGDAGPSNLGYFSGCWSPLGDAILANGYTGALHLWRRPEGRLGVWSPRPAVSGHFAPVVDLAWAIEGTCLVSVSADQTARVTACARDGAWVEIARPQVHGHDFSCIASFPETESGGPSYASGSEEKVIRILEGPTAFLDTLGAVTGRHSETPREYKDVALGAAVPALGLSNKAVYAAGEEAAAGGEGPDLAPKAAPAVVHERPFEEHLQQSTLWPEVYKAYGHGNEIHCLAADPAGRYLASACKAQSKEVAAIWIWRVGTWAAVQQLEGHTLTVTQMAFSPDGASLVSVSRDRSLAIWKRRADESSPFVLTARVQKAHSRVLWAVACSDDSSFFATGARDNLVKLWSLRGEDGEPRKPIAALPGFSSSVQALAMTGVQGRNSMQDSRQHLLAVGLEDGGILLLRLCVGEVPGGLVRHECVWSAPPHMKHAGPLRALKWRPGREGASDLLASAGNDHAVHLYQIRTDLA